MRVIRKRPLIDFWTRHSDVEQSLKAWLSEVEGASWKTPQDIKARYPHASLIGQNRVVFNIKGSRYRLVVGVAYGPGAVYVKFIGSHAEYDRIDAATVDMEY